jgi:hypothetical protein
MRAARRAVEFVLLYRPRTPVRVGGQVSPAYVDIESCTAPV